MGVFILFYSSAHVLSEISMLPTHFAPSPAAAMAFVTSIRSLC